MKKKTASKKVPAKNAGVTHIHNHQPMIYIGAKVDAVKEARAAIMDILNSPYVDQGTKIVALESLSAITSVNDSTISNCNFSANPALTDEAK